eukprot:scaffold107749_cov42-Phaeocystis_antarctica.AAC.1
MIVTGTTCAAASLGVNNTVCAHPDWTGNGYCQQACFDAGHGYEDCCALPPQSPPTSPPRPPLPPPAPPTSPPSPRPP